MRQLFAIAVLLAVFQAGARAGVDANGQQTPQAEETPAEYNNWVTLGVGGVSLSGDGAQFQQRHWIKDGIFGGIEDLHWEPEINKDVTLKVDGHAMGGNEDYLASIELAFRDVGYIKAGYRGFRTWYDGNAGFFPRNGLFFELYDNDFSIDREDVWVELGLRVPNWPEITFRYQRVSREGQKDSTSWGDTTRTGLAADNTRNIVPTFLNIDERRDIFTLDLKHTIGQTDLGAGFRYEKQHNDDLRNVHRRPGEATSDRFFTQRDKITADLFSVHVFNTTRFFNDKLQFSTAYMFTTLDSNISGSRIYGASYEPVFDPVYARRQRFDEGFLNLMGGSQMSQHVATLSLAWRPWKNFVVVPSFRYEHNELDSITQYTETNVQPSPPPPGFLRALLEPLATESERWFDTVTESIEMRYTGLRDWTFYLRGEWMQEDLRQQEREREDTGALILERRTDGDILTQKYVAGVNWYPLARLNLAGQYYRKIHENDYANPVDSTTNSTPAGDRYPAFLRDQDFMVDDVNVRLTWRPLGNLTSVTRYDFQRATVDTRGDFLRTVQSADVTAHVLSESITWTPLARLYVQGTVHYVRNETDTPADQQLNNVVLDAKNNYWNGSISAGYALDDKTDIQATYFYYRADNFWDNSAFSQPYGVSAEEHAVTATITREITTNIRGSFKYGYFTNRDQTSGGRNNYDAHLFATSLQYRF